MTDSAAGAPAPEEIARAADLLRAGELVGMPTETVYGLAADARNPEAVAKIFATKGRPADHPLIVHLSGADQLDLWAREVPEAARRLAAAFWPGPLTLILKRLPDVPDAVTGGQDTVGLRVPDHPVALALLRAFGGGLAAPSANRFGHVSPTTAQHVVDEFGAALGAVLDGGPCRVGIESTILDLSGGVACILRPGAIGAAQIAAVIGVEPEVGPGERKGGAVPRVSGSLKAHYAPRTPMQMVQPERLRDVLNMYRHSGRSCAVIAYDQPALADCPHHWLMLPADPKGYARGLYAALRAADRAALDMIVLEALPQDAAWSALHDRLGRALAGAGRH